MLFHRLLATAGRDRVELESGLCFEFNSQPTSLFNKEGLMNTANKPALTEALWEMTEKSMPNLSTSNNLYLLDGGDLLSKPQICQHYVNYVNGNHGENAEVLFDDYLDKPTAKDTTHLKQTKGKEGRLVKFALNSKMSMSKEKFLLNNVNKQEFLGMHAIVLSLCTRMLMLTYSGVDLEIFKRGRGGALCKPPWLAGEENFRFQMV